MLPRNMSAPRHRSQWQQVFRTNQRVKAATASRRQQPVLRRAIGGLDTLICSEKTLGIAIDGFL